MTSKDLARLLTQFDQRGEAHLDDLGRALHAYRLMPTGGRGTNAPTINHTHAANVLIALAVGGAPLVAARRVPIYRMLTPSWSGIGAPPPPEECNVFGDTLGEALEFLLLGRAPNVREVQVMQQWPRAIVDLRDGRRFYYGVASCNEARDAGETTSLIHSRMILPASLFSEIRVLLGGSTDDEGKLLLEGLRPDMPSITWH